jgi:hypothetical protein
MEPGYWACDYDALIYPKGCTCACGHVPGKCEYCHYIVEGAKGAWTSKRLFVTLTDKSKELQRARKALRKLGGASATDFVQDEEG